MDKFSSALRGFAQGFLQSGARPGPVTESPRTSVLGWREVSTRPPSPSDSSTGSRRDSLSREEGDAATVPVRDRQASTSTASQPGALAPAAPPALSRSERFAQLLERAATAPADRWDQAADDFATAVAVLHREPGGGSDALGDPDFLLGSFTTPAMLEIAAAQCEAGQFARLVLAALGPLASEAESLGCMARLLQSPGTGQAHAFLLQALEQALRAATPQVVRATALPLVQRAIEAGREPVVQRPLLEVLGQALRRQPAGRVGVHVLPAPSAPGPGPKAGPDPADVAGQLRQALGRLEGWEIQQQRVVRDIEAQRRAVQRELDGTPGDVRRTTLTGQLRALNARLAEATERQRHPPRDLGLLRDAWAGPNAIQTTDFLHTLLTPGAADPIRDHVAGAVACAMACAHPRAAHDSLRESLGELMENLVPRANDRDTAAALLEEVVAQLLAQPWNGSLQGMDADALDDSLRTVQSHLAIGSLPGEAAAAMKRALEGALARPGLSLATRRPA